MKYKLSNWNDTKVKLLILAEWVLLSFEICRDFIKQISPPCIVLAHINIYTDLKADSVVVLYTIYVSYWQDML